MEKSVVAEITYLYKAQLFINLYTENSNNRQGEI